VEEIYFRVLFPMPAFDYHPGLVEIVKYLIKHKAEWDFVMFREIKPGHYEFVVTFDVLEMVSDRLPRKSHGRFFKSQLIPGRIPLCQRCGCHYYSTRASGFRATDGMVSKVRECPFCYGLNNEAAIATAEVYRTGDAPAAIAFQMQNFMKQNGEQT